VNGSSFESEIAAAQATPVAVTSDPVMDWNPVWSPDGGSLFFASERGGSMNLWRVAIDEASAKVRSGPPVDDDADYALPIWAGVVPVRVVAGEARDDGRLAPGTTRPDGLDCYAHLGLVQTG